MFSVFQKESTDVIIEEDIFFFIDEQDEPINGEEVTLNHKQHVHGFHCKKVVAFILYNGHKAIIVPPNTKVFKLLDFATKEFSINDADAGNMILLFGNNTFESTERIGSYVTKYKCVESSIWIIL